MFTARAKFMRLTQKWQCIKRKVRCKLVKIDHNLWQNRGKRLAWRRDLDHTHGRITGVGPMESVIRNLRIQTLKSQLDVCHLVCATVANELRAADLAPEHRATLARRWDKALDESRGLQRAIDLLERQEMGSTVAVF